jgi:hypothetical protein
MTVGEASFPAKFFQAEAIIRSCLDSEKLTFEVLTDTKQNLLSLDLPEVTVEWMIGTIVTASSVIQTRVSILENRHDGILQGLVMAANISAPTFVGLNQFYQSGSTHYQGVSMSSGGEQNVNYGNVANQGGRNNEANVEVQNQSENQISGDVNWPAVADELKRVLVAMTNDEPDDAEHHMAVGAVKAAEVAARKGEGSKALQFLQTSGKYVFEFAKKIGSDLLIEVLKPHLGLPPS